MAEASELEHIAKNAPHQEKKGDTHKEEGHKAGTLESVVNETSHLFGSTLKVGLAGAVPYAFASAVPSMAKDTAILTGAQIASDYTTDYQRDQKYTAGNLLESAVLGTATTPIIETMFRVTNSIPTNNLLGYIAKGSVWGGVMYPSFVGSYLPIAYLVRNRTFKGMGKYIKENYWPILKKAWKWLLPFSLANIYFAPQWLQIPISAAISYVYDRFAAAPKDTIPEEQKRDKTPYYVAASRALYKLGYNVFWAPLKAAEAIGSGIRDLYKSAASAAKPAALAPAHAAAPAHHP